MVEINNKTKHKINLRLVASVANSFLKTHQKEDCEVSIAFVGDKKIRQLNEIYRGVNEITDVLAFPGEESSGSEVGVKFLGEIVIDYAQIKRQAKKFNNSVRQELIFILVHGLFHLLGYNDSTEKGRREMEELGRDFMKRILN